MKRLLFILSLSPLFTCAQVNLDSLWDIWNDINISDTTRMKAMDELAWQSIYNQPDSVLKYSDLLFDFAKECENKEMMVVAINTQGISYYMAGNYEKAIESYKKGLQIDKNAGNTRGVISFQNNIGGIYWHQGNYHKAIEYFTRSLKNSEKIEDSNSVALALNNIGNIYSEQNDHPRALKYFKKSLVIFESLSNKEGVARSLNNLGLAYFDLENTEKSLEFYEKCITIRKNIGDKVGLIKVLNNLGNVYSKEKQQQKALEYYTEGYNLSKEIGDLHGEIISLNNIGDAQFKSNNFKLAIKNALIAYALSSDVGDITEVKKSTKTLYESYKAINEKSKALEMYEIYISIRDSILSEENKKEIIRQEFNYNYGKQKAIDDAENEKLITIEHQEKQKQKVISYSIGLGLGLVVIFLIFVFNRLQVTRKQKLIIEKQKEVVEFAHQETQQQKKIIEEAHQEIKDSIAYAKRIQSAILPPTKLVKEYLKESFILYKPKDIVAGDFYWMEHKDGKILYAAADCTGHGVPGAMVSVVCNNGLNRSVREYGLTDPGKILDKTREIVIQEFEKSEEDVKDGMDIALCSIEGNKLKYAGAHNPLWIIRNGEIIEIKANKQPIGQFDHPEPYTTHTFDLESGDSIYIFSDGYVDQFGGEKGKKFKSKAFRELLLSIQDKSMEAQKITIDEAFEIWKGSLEQIDDVCIIGVRI
jgi:serine phosphatase RsbU (regulator of sigma subunit)/TPR repeat protein